MSNLDNGWIGTDSVTSSKDKLILALPKGRILNAIRPIMARAGLTPEDAFLMKRIGGYAFQQMTLRLTLFVSAVLMWPLSLPMVRRKWGSPGKMC